jgi:hypothetical protein
MLKKPTGEAFYTMEQHLVNDFPVRQKEKRKNERKKESNKITFTTSIDQA